MANIGPVILSVVGDVFTQGVRIGGIIWEGTTTSGDTVELKCPGTNTLLWSGRTSDTETYLGAAGMPPLGIHCPNGFQLSQISAGRLLVYINEN